MTSFVRPLRIWAVAKQVPKKLSGLILVSLLEGTSCQACAYFCEWKNLSLTPWESPGESQASGLSDSFLYLLQTLGLVTFSSCGQWQIHF